MTSDPDEVAVPSSGPLPRGAPNARRRTPLEALVTNLADNLTQTAEKHGDRPAVRLDDLVLTYAELQEGARRVAGLLKEKGVGPGDRVGLVLPNVPPFPVLFYGALAAGAVVVPMNPLLKGREVEYYLKDSDASIVFAWKDMAEEAGKGAKAVDIECVEIDPDGFVELLGQYDPVEEVVDRDGDDTVDRCADRPGLAIAIGVVERRDRRGLREPVALQDDAVELVLEGADQLQRLHRVEPGQQGEAGSAQHRGVQPAGQPEHVEQRQAAHHDVALGRTHRSAGDDPGA
jgi:hypothetical protein